MALYIMASISEKSSFSCLSPYRLPSEGNERTSILCANASRDLTQEPFARKEIKLGSPIGAELEAKELKALG
jgi:hypothetical protein